jgi:hypothetical protein
MLRTIRKTYVLELLKFKTNDDDDYDDNNNNNINTR